MKTVNWTKPAEVFIDFGHTSIKICHGEAGVELTVERTETGRLTPLCQEHLRSRMSEFLNRHKVTRPARALCAITARGVSLRQVKLPPTTKETFDSLLQLQVEREFPLPPDELAWGACHPDDSNSPNGQPQNVTVVALRKQTIDEYATLLSQCGLDPVFTLSALAVKSICDNSAGTCAVLDIGRDQSELTSFDNGSVAAIRTIPWGGENLTGAIQASLNISEAEAEELKLKADSSSNPKVDEQVQAAVAPAFSLLARLIRSEWNGPRLYLTGKSAAFKAIGPSLSQALEGQTVCEPKPAGRRDAQSAAIVGLRDQARRNGHCPPLVIRAATVSAEPASAPKPQVRAWLALAACLALASLSLRYVEPVIQTPRLSARIAQVQAAEESLSGINIELAFLQYLQTNQPPFLQVLSVIAEASPQGTLLEQVSLDRRGDASIRGTLAGPTQATDFRSKLIASGWFSDVVLDEQTPKDKKVGVRMSAQWNLQGPPTPSSATPANTQD